MNGQEKAVKTILDLMQPLSEIERLEVWASVNKIICFECGYGSEANPNPGCQFWNDE